MIHRVFLGMKDYVPAIWRWTKIWGYQDVEYVDTAILLIRDFVSKDFGVVLLFPEPPLPGYPFGKGKLLVIGGESMARSIEEPPGTTVQTCDLSKGHPSMVWSSFFKDHPCLVWSKCLYFPLFPTNVKDGTGLLFEKSLSANAPFLNSSGLAQSLFQSVSTLIDSKCSKVSVPELFENHMANFNGSPWSFFW